MRRVGYRAGRLDAILALCGLCDGGIKLGFYLLGSRRQGAGTGMSEGVDEVGG